MKVRTRQSCVWGSQNRNSLVGLRFHYKLEPHNCNKLHIGRLVCLCIAPFEGHEVQGSTHMDLTIRIRAMVFHPDSA